MDLWLDLIWNSFCAHILLPPNSDAVLYGFAAFQHPDWQAATVIAVLIGTIANFSSYVLGFYLSTFKDKKKFLLDEIQYATIQRIMRRYGVFILLVQTFPLYSILPLLMGFFRVKPLHVVALTGISLAVHHYLNMQAMIALVSAS